MPKVSVVIAARNNEHNVAAAVHSVLEQSVGEFELIITDDASDDNTFDQIQQFTDPRITILRNSSPMGFAGALNRSSSVATGEYLVWLDSDDILEPHMLESLLAYMEGNSDKFGVFGLAKTMTREGEKVAETDNVGVEADRFELLNLLFQNINPFARSGGLVRRDVVVELGSMPQEFSRNYEPAFWTKLLFHGELDVIPDYVVTHREYSAARIAARCAPALNEAAFEAFEILNLYSEYIKDSAQLLKIFPEIKNVNLPVHDQLLQFHLALTAVSCTSPSNQLYGLHVMHNLLKNPEMVTALKSDCGFTARDLFDMEESFSVLTNGENTIQVSDFEGQIEELNDRLGALQSAPVSNTPKLKPIIGDLQVNYRYTLPVWEAVFGILAREGPHHSLGIPFAFWWCTGPLTTLKLTTENSGAHLLLFECQNQHFESLTIEIKIGTEYSDSFEIKPRPGLRPYCFQAKADLSAGVHDVSIKASKWCEATADSPAQLAFMLHDIRLIECF